MPTSATLQDSGLPDLFAVGILLAIVGCFLLANSIVFRHPRALVAQFFGGAARSLTTIRAYIFHRVQIHLGFLFLLAGFGLQLFGRFRPPVEVAAQFPFTWVGLVVLAVVVLELAGWWLSFRLFRRYLREYLLRNPPDLEADLPLARELGDLFGISSQGDDSVPSYLLRIRHHIGLLGSRPPEGMDPERAARERELAETLAEEEFGVTR